MIDNNQREMMDIQSDYSQLLELYYQVVDSKRGDKLAEDQKWLYDAETLSVKLFNHLGTIQYLSQGTTLPKIDKYQRHFVDHASISVLARAAFETYLSFYFIFIDKKCSLPERKFRHLLWKLGGLNDRQKFVTVSKENCQKLDSENKIINKLQTELENTQSFLNLSPKLRKKAKQGEWRLNKGWADLAEIAGFDKEIFRKVYRYLCSYAHTGGLSGLQIGQAIKVDDQKGLCVLSVQFGLILLSHFLFSYTDLFPETKTEFAQNAVMHGLAMKWHVTWKEPEFKKRFIS